jgi:3-hydroxy-3-methylglutaryl CoA synthase
MDMTVWRRADIDNRASDIFDAAIEGAAQEVDLGDAGAAMVVPYREWLRLKALEARVASGEIEPSFHEWLFAAEPTFDIEFDRPSYVDGTRSISPSMQAKIDFPSRH